MIIEDALAAVPVGLRPAVELLCRSLDETNPTAVEQIAMIVRSIGEAASRALLLKTLEVEAKGGMKTLDGQRKRTAGGVFLYLARQQLSDADKHAVAELRNKQSPAIPDWSSDMFRRIARRALKTMEEVQAAQNREQAAIVVAPEIQAIRQILLEIERRTSPPVTVKPSPTRKPAPSKAPPPKPSPPQGKQKPAKPAKPEPISKNSARCPVCLRQMSQKCPKSDFIKVFQQHVSDCSRRIKAIMAKRPISHDSKGKPPSSPSMIHEEDDLLRFTRNPYAE